MGSTSSPNSWAPYGGYRDCSQGICNINCPQWCYIIFPPPPPANPYDDSGFNFSPLIIAVIGILASTFLLIFYYTIIAKYCKRRRNHQNHPSDDLEEGNISQLNQAQLQAHAGGLDEALIKSIAVCKYKRGDGLVEGTECAVCLGEFQENESLRLLPKCSHAFHLPCIDTWLKSHSSCPLCRANVVPMNTLFTPPRTTQSSSNLYISPLENHHQNDLILVVNEGERGHREEVVVDPLVNDVAPKMGETGLRRSASVDSFSSQGRVLVADILQISEGNEAVEMQIHRLDSGTGSSRSMWGENSAKNDGNAKGKSSTGNEKGKSSMVLN